MKNTSKQQRRWQQIMMFIITWFIFPSALNTVNDMFGSKLNRKVIPVFEKKFEFTNKKTLTEERRFKESLLSRSKLRRGTPIFIICSLYLRRQGINKKIINLFNHNLTSLTIETQNIIIINVFLFPLYYKPKLIGWF